MNTGDPQIYEPNFTLAKANALLNICLDSFQGNSTNLYELLLTLEQLATLIQKAGYDQKVLQNLIRENEMLVQSTRALPDQHPTRDSGNYNSVAIAPAKISYLR